MKLLPWSVNITRGEPKIETIDRIALAVSSEVYDLSGMANGKPEAISIEVKINLNFCLEIGKGPTISNASFSHL